MDVADRRANVALQGRSEFWDADTLYPGSRALNAAGVAERDSLARSMRSGAASQVPGGEAAALLARDYAALVAAGGWQQATCLVVQPGRLSIEAVAVRLGVSRSTVHRWMDGGTVPAEGAKPHMVQCVEEMLAA